ncbi:hypothetical protein BGLA2_70044 [Burkholderia gladioli]|nr:hypothetical protein BGLA2_70044 [Burkholderia gladioli]
MVNEAGWQPAPSLQTIFHIHSHH